MYYVAKATSHHGLVISSFPFAMIPPRLWNSVPRSCALVYFFALLANVGAAENDVAAEKKASYVPAQSIPVSCLNRTAYVYLPICASSSI